MESKRIAGIALVVIGFVIAYTGYEMSNSIGNQLSSAFKGSPTDSVMLRYVLGAVSTGVGAYLAR